MKEKIKEFVRTEKIVTPLMVCRMFDLDPEEVKGTLEELVEEKEIKKIVGVGKNMQDEVIVKIYNVYEYEEVK